MNIIDMIVILLLDKKICIEDIWRKIMGKEFVLVRVLVSLIGLFVLFFSVVDFGLLYYRMLEKEKIWFLKMYKGNFDGWMKVLKNMKVELNWWIFNIML